MDGGASVSLPSITCPPGAPRLEPHPEERRRRRLAHLARVAVEGDPVARLERLAPDLHRLGVVVNLPPPAPPRPSAVAPPWAGDGEGGGGCDLEGGAARDGRLAPAASNDRGVRRHAAALRTRPSQSAGSKGGGVLARGGAARAWVRTPSAACMPPTSSGDVSDRTRMHAPPCAAARRARRVRCGGLALRRKDRRASSDGGAPRAGRHLGLELLGLLRGEDNLADGGARRGGQALAEQAGLVLALVGELGVEELVEVRRLHLPPPRVSPLPQASKASTVSSVGVREARAAGAPC